MDGVPHANEIDLSTLLSYVAPALTRLREALGDRITPDDERLLPYFVILGALIFVYLPLMLLLRVFVFSRRKKTATKKTEDEKPKHIATSRMERFLQWLAPPEDPWLVGNIIVSFKWLAHCIVFGTTGSGKSTFVMTRILRPPLGLPGLIIRLIWLFTQSQWPKRERRGMLLFAGNESRPFIAAVLWLIEHGYPACIWTPDPLPGTGFGLDVLEGPPDNFAQRVIAMQPVGTGNTGLQSGAVEGMLVDTAYTLDRDHKPRNFANVLETIRTVGIRDLDEYGKPTGEPRELTRQEQMGLENWCTRLSTLRRRLGASIGSDVKLSEALAKGWIVLVQGSSYANPNTTDQLANLFVYYSMWLVTKIGNFDLIIDEPGAVPADTFTKLLTATRAQGVRIMIMPQSLEQIDKKLREMCTTALLLGGAGASPEARELASKIVEKTVDPIDFSILKPTTWRERTVFWRPRRGLHSLEGYLLDNGRLDRVKTKPADLSILKRWPKGSIPKLPAESSSDWSEGTAPTGNNGGSPESAWVGDHGDEAEAGCEDEGESVVDVVSMGAVGAGSVPPEVAMQSTDGRRIWGKGVVTECRTLLNASASNLPEGLKVPHRFWTGGNNGTDRALPKDQVKGLYGEDKGKRKTVTVYVWWYELLSGKPRSKDKPTIDHLCHTYDDSCPGPTPCEIPWCDDPAHPVGMPCQHPRCYEFSHEEAVSQAVNNQRQRDQRARHQTWLHNQEAKAA